MLIKIGNDDELGGIMGNSIIVLIPYLFVRMMLCSAWLFILLHIRKMENLSHFIRTAP